MMHVDKKTQKWIYFFRLLDSNQDGVLEPVDIVILVNRVFASVPGKFSEAEQNYIKAVTLKHFDRLIIEARSHNNRKISLRKWISILNQNSKAEEKKSYFIRWFATCAVRFVFNLFDQNKDGYIDFDEFEMLFKILDLERSNIIYAFKQLDQNNDNKISRLELHAAVKDFFSDNDSHFTNYVFGQFQLVDNAYMSKLLTA